MIEDPTRPRSPLRPSARAASGAGIDFDRLGDLEDLAEALDGEEDAAFDEGSFAPVGPGGGPARDARGPARGSRGGVGVLLRMLRPWFDPRPGELRGVIIVLSAGLVLTSALWFDASRRPNGEEPQAFTAVTVVDAGDDWADAVQPTAAAAVAITDVVVHVSGAVAQPGLLVLVVGARVGDAILAAGGATEDAQLDRLNLARLLEDGEQVHVPRPGEDVGISAGPSSRGILADGRVDVNTASAQELTTLPGIGPARAQAIIAARQERPFSVPGDLRRVSGIGEATFQRLAPLISVG